MQNSIAGAPESLFQSHPSVWILSTILQLFMPSLSRLPVYFRYADYYINAVLDKLFSPGGNHLRNGEFAVIRSILKNHAANYPSQELCFVDAGAERGVHSSYVIELGQTILSGGLRVFAVEPLPQYANQLRSKLDHSVAVIIDSALGASPKNVKYYYNLSSDGVIGSRSLFSHNPAQETSIAVDVLELDELARSNSIEKIHLLKIDVEGGELNVLRGSQTLLQRGCIDYILLEYSHLWLAAGESLFRLIEMFALSDYSLYQVYPYSLRSVPSWDPYLDDFRLRNYLLVRRGLPLPLPSNRMALPFLRRHD